MANDIQTPPAPGAPVEPGIAVMLKGVLDDALELIKQQFAMVKAEFKADFVKVRDGLIPIALGITPLLLGGLMLCFTLVHLIHWAATPANAATADPATIPLWGCYGIVSGTFLLIGGIALGLGIYRLKSVNPLPDESVKALEENVKWLMNPNPK
jgi:hypothetical protein